MASYHSFLGENIQLAIMHSIFAVKLADARSQNNANAKTPVSHEDRREQVGDDENQDSVSGIR